MSEHEIKKPLTPPEIPEISDEAIFEVLSLDADYFKVLAMSNRNKQKLLYGTIEYLVNHQTDRDRKNYDYTFAVIDYICLTLEQQAKRAQVASPNSPTSDQFMLPTISQEACQRFFIKKTNRPHDVDTDKYEMLRDKQPALFDFIENRTDVLDDPRTAPLFKKVLGWGFEIIE